jgi:hypothetical protein
MSKTEAAKTSIKDMCKGLECRVEQPLVAWLKRHTDWVVYTQPVSLSSDTVVVIAFHDGAHVELDLVSKNLQIVGASALYQDSPYLEGEFEVESNNVIRTMEGLLLWIKNTRKKARKVNAR